MRLQGLLLLLLLAGCGKEIEGKGGAGDRIDPINPSDLPKVLREQEIVCKFNNCPKYVGKLVVYNNEILSTCAGTLIADNKFVVNASCLPKNYRTETSNCRDHFFAVFPSEDQVGRNSEIVGCSKVTYVSPINSSVASLNRDNIAVIELQKNLETRLPIFSFEGVTDFEYLRIFRIFRETDTKAYIERVSATSHLGSLANPLATHRKAQNIPLVSRKIKRDLLPGGIVTNLEGKVVGLEYSQLSSEFYNYLTSKQLMEKNKKHYSFLINFSCSSLFYPNLNECKFYSNTQDLYQARLKMIADDNLFKNARAEAQKALDETLTDKDYIKFEMKVDQRGEYLQDLDLIPTCFKDHKNWIDNPEFKTKKGKSYKKNFDYEFYFSKNRLIKKVSSNLKVYVHITATGSTKQDIKFKPRQLANREYSPVRMNVHLNIPKLLDCTVLESDL